jgi:hypothetical protein
MFDGSIELTLPGIYAAVLAGSGQLLHLEVGIGPNLGN